MFRMTSALITASGRNIVRDEVNRNEQPVRGTVATIEVAEKSFSRSFFLVFFLVLLLDRVTKELAPSIPAGGIPLIPGVLGLRYAENRGAAFSILSGYPRLLGVLSLVILVAAFLWLRKKHLAPFPLVALSLMAGGAAGNMFDRLIRGYVPDMIETLFISFPVFNIADSCLTVGCALMVISLLFRPKDWEKGTKA